MMKNLLLVGLFFSSLAYAHDQVELSVMHPCGADSDTQHSFRVISEYRTGLFAWKQVSDAELCVVEGEESHITYNFKGQTYQVKIRFTGQINSAGHWNLDLQRTDYDAGTEIGGQAQVNFTTSDTHFTRISTSGRYRGQLRQIRVNIKE